MKKTILTLMVAAAAYSASFAANERPNFIVILTDDQRTDTLGVYNDKCPIQTPNIDRLATEGVRFDNGFVTTPICVVSRACILTGRYESNNRVHAFNKLMEDDVFEHSYPVYLRKAGYFSGHFGKYGVGISKMQEKQFDMFDGQSGQGPKFRDYKGRRMHDAEWLAVKAEEFFDAVPEGKPFVLQLSYKEPHASSCPAPEDDDLLKDVEFERSPQDTKEAFDALPDVAKLSLMERVYAREFDIDGSINYYMRQYHEKIAGVERSVGKVMEMLEKRGLDDNTVVVFLSDHGTHFGEKQLAGKWTPYEQSLRIPFIIYDPRASAVHGAVSDKMVLNIDIAPTLLDMAGLPVPGLMDGESLVPLMSGKDVPWRTEFAFEHFTSPAKIMRPIPRNDGIRTDNFKYVRWFDVDPPIEELFDLRKDPMETTNLASNPEYGEKLKQMQSEYAVWRKANPSTFMYDSYGSQPHSGAPDIDWETFRKAQPEAYEKIARQVKKMGVTWEQAVNDRGIRNEICKNVGYWY
jgi:arylsulfatase A-like enzyme